MKFPRYVFFTAFTYFAVLNVVAETNLATLLGNVSPLVFVLFVVQKFMSFEGVRPTTPVQVTAVFCSSAIESAQNDHLALVHTVMANKERAGLVAAFQPKNTRWQCIALSITQNQIGRRDENNMEQIFMKWARKGLKSAGFPGGASGEDPGPLQGNGRRRRERNYFCPVGGLPHERGGFGPCWLAWLSRQACKKHVLFCNAAVYLGGPTPSCKILACRRYFCKDEGTRVELLPRSFVPWLCRSVVSAIFARHMNRLVMSCW